MSTPLTINSVETLQEALPIIRASQEAYGTFTQEQVDAICEKTAMAVSKMRIPLAKMACEETGYGIVVDKVTKNQYASEHVWNYMRNKKTCGVISEDKAYGVKKIASPKGVIAAITPTTNPTSTTIYKIMLALKTRNAVILSPHPHAVNCSIAAAKIMRDAAIEAGLPEHVISWISVPSMEISDVLMKSVDLIMATGGSGMVKAAYSSGTPAIGVGPGNCNVVIDESADLRMAVESIIHSKTFDNGMICASEQHITVLANVYDEVKRLLKEARCYFLNDDEAAKVAEVFFNSKTHGVKPPAVGQTACRLAEMAGIEVPYDTKVLIYETNDTSHDCAWANEKLTTLLGMYKAETLDEAFDICYKLVLEGGAGHSAALYIDPTEEEKITKFGLRMKAGRILINQPTSFGGIGDLYNFGLAPSLTLGPGSVGHSAFMGNTNYEQLLDIKNVTIRKENMLWLQLPKKVYYKTGCTPVALREMKEVYNFKRAFIITDSTLYQLGACDAIINQLRDMGIETAEFFDIRVDPQIQDAMKGLPKMHEFEPDVIIAVGGGSAIDTAKIMWIMYENPEEGFLDMATTFLDIRKRIRFFPQMGKKAKLVCIPTSSGTGSEVTPFAVITDHKTGYKYPITDYALTPSVAIVDPVLARTQPRKLASDAGFDALTHAFEAYVSVYANDFTDGMALHAAKLVWDNLAESVNGEPGEEKTRAQEKMHNAATMAGMAFGSAFLGMCHGMAHTIGALCHVAHGRTNSILLPYVIRYNGSVPEEPTSWPKYNKYIAPERYQEIAKNLGVNPGKTPEEGVENLAKAVEDYRDNKLGMNKSFQECGVDEDYYWSIIDQIGMRAYEDQCAPANPRIPQIEDMKDIAIAAYYGVSQEEGHKLRIERQGEAATEEASERA